jgi:hypothetical protein
MVLLDNLDWHNLELPPINLYNAPRVKQNG